jgi:hypothetical protein
MTQEELLALEGEKKILHTMMSALSGNLRKLKQDIKEALEQFEVFNKKYTEIDRKIAFATKVQVITRKKPEMKMTADQAQEMLTLLGYSNLTLVEGEDNGSETDCDL